MCIHTSDDIASTQRGKGLEHAHWEKTIDPKFDVVSVSIIHSEIVHRFRIFSLILHALIT